MAGTPGGSGLTGRRIGVYELHALLGAGDAVRHFHDRRGANNISTSLGNAITAEGFLYETSSTIGSLWRLTTPTAQP